jgi:hypothetical protein
MSFDKLSQSILTNAGQNNISADGASFNRVVYPAIVVNVNDPLGLNRLQARIINLDESENIVGGKDRDRTDANLPLCFPMLPEFFHSRPDIGEMVMLIIENPHDETSPRYWMGPIINTQLKLKYQGYKEAVKLFDQTLFNVNPTTQNQKQAPGILPGQGDIALQGRSDADLILKIREVYLVAGKFKDGTLDANVDNPSFLQLRQILIGETREKEISQANLQSTNVNIYSPVGKFRNKNIAQFEINSELGGFGENAASLHPVVFGDELVRLLDLIINTLLTHIHTPQSPLVPSPFSAELQLYTITGKLQNLISNHVRVN